MLPIPALDELPSWSWKEKLAYLVYRSRNEMEQAACPVTHLFDNGQYIREMKIPAGTFFLGRAHRYGHECVLVSGEVVHITEQDRRHVAAPFSMRTTPGYQMVLYALTDVVGRTIHPNPTESRDTDALEADIFEPVEDLMALGSTLHYRLEQCPE